MRVRRREEAHVLRMLLSVRTRCESDAFSFGRVAQSACKVARRDPQTVCVVDALTSGSSLARISKKSTADKSEELNTPEDALKGGLSKEDAKPDSYDVHNTYLSYIKCYHSGPAIYATRVGVMVPTEGAIQRELKKRQ